MTPADRDATYARILASAEDWLATARADYCALISPVMIRDVERRDRAARAVDRAAEHLAEVRGIVEAYRARMERGEP